MTYTKPQIDPDFNIIPGEDIEIRARKMAAAGQKQVAEDIARLKAMGEPIHYMLGHKLVREEANGERVTFAMSINTHRLKYHNR